MTHQIRYRLNVFHVSDDHSLTKSKIVCRIVFLNFQILFACSHLIDPLDRLALSFDQLEFDNPTRLMTTQGSIGILVAQLQHSWLLQFQRVPLKLRFTISEVPLKLQLLSAQKSVITCGSCNFRGTSEIAETQFQGYLWNCRNAYSHAGRYLNDGVFTCQEKAV